MKGWLSAYALAALLAGVSGFPGMAAAQTSINTVWSVDVDQRLPNAPIALSSPAVVEHGDKAWLVLAGRDAWVHVYDLVSGDEVKRFFLGHPSDSGAVALEHGLVALGDIKGHVYVVDPAKGEMVWQKRLGSSFTMIPQVIGGDFLVQTSDNEVYRFSPQGEKRWSYSGSKNTLSFYLGAQPLIHQDVIYAVQNNGDVVALKAYTGDVLWRQQTIVSNSSTALSDFKAPLAQPLYVSRLALNGEQVKHALLVPVFQGDLVVLSVLDGSPSFTMPVSLKSSPLIMGKHMYMADSHGFLHLYDIQDGHRLWSKKLSSHALMGPVSFAGSLWVTDNQGQILRISPNGEVEAIKQLQGHIARLPVVTSQGLVIRTDRGEMTLVK